MTIRRAAALALLSFFVVPMSPAAADHDGDCREEECYDGGGQSYDGQWSNEDENRNRNRNRGSFSPGPFDRSPMDLRDNCISLDCSGRDQDDKKEPRDP